MNKIIQRLKLKHLLKNKLFIFDLFLLVIAVIYYAQFLQRGMVAMDEGYFLHMSERIFRGEVPFRDFISQYNPGYFYLIAIFFKFFGPSILISRILSLSFCIGILGLIFLILYEIKIAGKVFHFLAFLSIISFGYPLLNIAAISWPVVFFSLCLTLLLLKYLKKPSPVICLLMCFTLALTLFFKQNFGIYFSTLVFLLILLNKHAGMSKIKAIFWIFLPFILLTLSWMYFLYFKNPEGFLEFIKYSINFGTTFKFSYPPFSLLLSPFGIFKLIPYYLPPVFFLSLMYLRFKKKVDNKIFIVCIFSLVGFLGLIYPGSDLLHLYPFYGFVLVSLLILLIKKQKYAFVFFLIFLNVFIGFYLTLFREYYRYYPPYRFQNTALKINKAENILVPKERALAINNAYNFIQKNTAKNEPIFVFPASPMFYFLFDRPNPSKDSLYINPYSMYSPEKVLQEIKLKKVRFVVTDGKYDNLNSISAFIQKQKMVFSEEQIRIFLIDSIPH